MGNKIIKAKCLVAIASSKFSYRPNQVIDLDPETAKEWEERDMIKILPLEPSPKKSKTAL